MKHGLVPSIHCSSCAEYIRSALSPLPLRNLTVDIIQRSLSFTFDKESDPTQISHAVERLLDDAGYKVEPPLAPRQSLLQRARNIIPGLERRRRQRHLRHCSACQAEEGMDVAEKGEGPSLQSIQVHTPKQSKPHETRLSIEGMTCRYVLPESPSGKKSVIVS